MATKNAVPFFMRELCVWVVGAIIYSHGEYIVGDKFS